MAAKYILVTLGVIFLVAAASRAGQVGAGHPQVRTWALIGVVFLVVSAWLFTRA